MLLMDEKSICSRDNDMLLFAVFAEKCGRKDHLQKERKRERDTHRQQKKIRITHMQTKQNRSKANQSKLN